MLYVKENPIGVDIPIQRMQTYLFGILLELWGISEQKYRSYCRVYRNQSEKGYYPEFYMGGGDYREAFVDDTVYATSFFQVGEKSVVNTGALQSDTAIIFHVNLDKLNPEVKHRADEEIRQDIIAAAGHAFGFSFVSLETGIANVFKEYDISRIKFRDMHPFHCFRLNYKINYTKC